MEERRFHFEVDLPELSDFEVAVLKRLRAAAPRPLPYSELCQPYTPQNLSYLNRLAVTGLAMQFNSEPEGMFMTLTSFGEQAVGALEKENRDGEKHDSQ